MQPGRGHRGAIMGNFSNVGLALLPDPLPGVGPLVFSGAYINANGNAPDHHNRFLVGTVWTDTNGNNRYNAGEGLGNVRVQPASGAWHAITPASGGWAIPVTSPGSYTLTFSGGSLSASEARTVTVAGVSVLVDVKVTPGAAPFALESRREASGNILLAWSGGTAPFQVQRSASLTGTWENVGAPINGRSLSVTPSGNRAFYRVMQSQ